MHTNYILIQSLTPPLRDVGIWRDADDNDGDDAGRHGQQPII